jgi:quercetin dioxygenase-like cupin family protein
VTTIRALAALEDEPHANVFPESEPKTIRLSLDTGEQIPAHTHPDRDIVLYLVDGAVELQLGDETHDLTAGDIARFEGEQEISQRAVADSTALIVLAQRATE